MAPTGQVLIYTMPACPYCERAKRLLAQRAIPFTEKILHEDDDAEWNRLYRETGLKTVPQIFVGSRCIGGYTDLARLDSQDELKSIKTEILA